ncbi:MAG: sodium:proton antiporter [Planctomycetes bacterium]|nr:sodium:proton antiporter [Planctomycetota bacterium]
MNLLANAGAVYPTWSVLPFAALLLCIAILPLVVDKWWHRNRNKALIGIVFGVPTAAFVAFHDPAVLGHTALEYLAFIALIGSLFVVSGGIEVRGTLSGTPLANAGLLALGALLANIVGTTGASMLLIRPFLRANRKRTEKGHLVVFFIFIVSNVGGLLTPLGDPPLFLGFLHGVPFQWTLVTLWPQWAVVVGACLAVFSVIDSAKYRRENHHLHSHSAEVTHDGPRIAVKGGLNLVLLLAIVGAVYAGGAWIKPLAVAKFGHESPWADVVAQAFQIVSLAAVAGVSLATTSHAIRQDNEFSWHPLIEVSVLFAGIFAAMIPALGVLQQSGGRLGFTEPWKYFWATGALSSFLDNAPTYLAFHKLAQVSLPGTLAGTTAAALAAVSCGAVFFGAMTYIGNGPNFMVKAIADHAGVKTPSFFGYMAWSLGILAPIFVAVTLIFFH